jgi:hypothetical protein
MLHCMTYIFPASVDEFRSLSVLQEDDCQLLGYRLVSLTRGGDAKFSRATNDVQ